MLDKEEEVADLTTLGEYLKEEGKLVILEEGQIEEDE